MLYTVRIFSYFWAFYSLRLQKRQQNEISVNPILFVIQIDNPVRWIETVTHVVERHWDIVHVSFWYHCSACTLLILNSTGVYICSMSLNIAYPFDIQLFYESIETVDVKWKRNRNISGEVKYTACRNVTANQENYDVFQSNKIDTHMCALFDLIHSVRKLWLGRQR